MPRVSVIVPVYKAEAYLPRCVDSLLGQTLRDMEIILVDDGSPDGCPALCEEYARRDGRVRVIHQENRGQGLARNAGISAARGEYVGFADSDDYVLPEMFQRLYEAAARYDADMVLSGARYLGGVLYEREGAEEVKYAFAREELFDGEAGIRRLMLGCAGALPDEREDSRYGFAVWKNLFRRARLMDGRVRFLSEREIMSEDVLFLLDYLARCRRAVGIPGAWYCYCLNGTSFSNAYCENRFAQAKRLVQELDRRLAAVAPEEFQTYTDRQFQAYARVISVQEVRHSRETGLRRQDIRRRLRDICADSALQTVLRRYPYWRLPRMQAAFAFAMRYRLVWLERAMALLRRRKQ